VHILWKCIQLHGIGYPRTIKNSFVLEFYNLKAVGYDTSMKTFVTWNFEIFRKAEKCTFWRSNEFENFRIYVNAKIFKTLVTLWSSDAQMNMTILTMFAQNLNTLAPNWIQLDLRRQRVKNYVMKTYGGMEVEFQAF
jgi:hypothetical protein